jgi:3-mercaptopyruvate sulfurtransferase SseA
VAQELLDMNFAQVVVLKGGWQEWEKADYPTDPKG